MVKLFGFQFAKEFLMSIFWTTWAVSLLEQGRTLSQACIALAIFFLANAAFEVPTGYFADRFGRKLATLLGVGLVGAGFGLNGFSLPAGAKVLAFFLSGIGFTLMSGANTAWFLAHAREKVQRFKQDHFFLELDLVGRLAMVCGAFGGVKLLAVSPALMWWVAGGVASLAFMIGLSIDESRAAEEKSDAAEIMTGLRTTIWSAVSIPAVAAVVASGTLFGFESGIRNVIFQPFILDLSHGNLNYLAYFQVTLAAVRLSGILAYRYYFAKFNKPVFMCALALAVFGLGELVASQVQSYWTFVAFYAPAIFMLGWYFPMRSSYVNGLLSDNGRATVLSFDSMMEKVASACSCLVLGLAINRETVQKWWFAAGMMLLTSSIAYILSAHPRPHRREM